MLKTEFSGLDNELERFRLSIKQSKKTHYTKDETDATTITVDNQGNNKLITSTAVNNTIQAEDNLTFNGSTLAITGNTNISGTLTTDIINEWTTDAGVTVEQILLKDGGITLLTGATVNTIETTLTNDDTHLPTSGAVIDAIGGGAITPAALTRTNDTNVTLTLGGTPSTALLQTTSLTLGWTGTLANGRIASAATWNAKSDVSINGSTANGVATYGGVDIIDIEPNLTFDGTEFVNKANLYKQYSTEAGKTDWRLTLWTGDADLVKIYNYDGGEAVYKNMVLGNGTNFLYLDLANTRVGINDATPSYTFDVNGTGRYTGTVTFNSHAYFGTNDVLMFGDNQDGRIYHDGADFYIRSYFDGGRIILYGNNLSNDGKNILIGDPDSAVTLYYAGSAKLATTSAGVSVTGNIRSSETKYWSCTGAHFSTPNPDTDNITKSAGLGTISADSDGISFLASVSLPNGAIVSAVKVYGNAAAAAETWTLVKGNIDSTTVVDMATALINTEDTSISNATINNASYVYFIKTTTLDTSDLIYGARITYTLA